MAAVGCRRGPPESSLAGLDLDGLVLDGLNLNGWRHAEVAAAWPGLNRAYPPDRAAAAGRGGGASAAPGQSAAAGAATVRPAAQGARRPARLLWPVVLLRLFRALVHDGVSPQRLAVKQELGTRLSESAGPPSPVPIQARHQSFDTRELGDYENQLSASPP